MKLRLLTIPALIFLGGFSFVSAQSYDDDDIYFNPDKAKKAVAVKKKAKPIRIRPFSLHLPVMSTSTTAVAFSLRTQYLSTLSGT